jgi:hypothetical protein
VPLAPKVGDLRYFLEAAGSQGVLVQPKAAKPGTVQLRTGFPTSLVLVAGVLAFLLAVDDLLLAPLRWGRAKLA